MSRKETVITKFQANRKRSLEFLTSLAPEEWETYTLGTWHLREVVAHLIGWSHESAKALHELARNLPPSYDTYDKGNDWAEINQLFINEYGAGTPSELIEKLGEVGEYLCAEAEKLSSQAFEEDNGVFRKNRQWTVYVELDDTSDHEVRHMQRVAEALGKTLPAA